MKRLLITMMILALSLLPVSAVAHADVPSGEFVLHSCDDYTSVDRDSSRVQLNGDFVKEGNSSFRIDSKWEFLIVNSVTLAIYYDTPLDPSREVSFDDAYFTMWVYVNDAETFSHSVDRTYISIGSNQAQPGLDRYYADTAFTTYTKGWNYVAIKLKDMVGMGEPRYESITSVIVRFDLEMPARAYIDDIKIVSEPLSDPDEGGYRVGEELIGHDTDVAKPSLMEHLGANVWDTVLYVAVLGVSVAATVVCVLRLVRRKGGKA